MTCFGKERPKDRPRKEPPSATDLRTTGAAMRSYLRVIARMPEAVTKALGDLA